MIPFLTTVENFRLVKVTDFFFTDLIVALRGMDKPFTPCYEPQYVTSTLAFHNEIKASSAQPANCGIKESEGCVGNESPTVLEFMTVATRVRIGTEPLLSHAEMCTVSDGLCR